jgi:transcriptional antiterminator NusG
MPEQSSLQEGGALPEASEDQAELPDEPSNVHRSSIEPACLHWYALYTHSRCEQLVCNQLSAKRFQVFFPKIEAWARRGRQKRLITTAMFPSYLLLCHAMDKESYIQIIKARGLVRILGERWDKLSVVSDAEIDSIQKVLEARVPILTQPFLKEGDRVRIMAGPLTGAEGILVQTKPSKGMLVLSVDLLQRSMAIEVDCSAVSAA